MPSKTPGGFRYSYQEYQKHLPAWTLGALLLLLVPILWIVLEDTDWTSARDFYFKIAAFHGFYEWISFGAKPK